MLGAIIGDIVGSRFEWNNNRSKQFAFMTYKCSVTDDSIMSLAIAKALLDSKADYSDLSENAVKDMQEIGRHYPDCGYGGKFSRWIFSNNPQPYGSYGNGAAMRVSPCGFVANDLDEVKQLSKAVTIVTHNHPEGLKGAEATAVAIFLARTGKSLFDIRNYITENYYSLDFTLAAITVGIAEAYYGIPTDIRKQALTFLYERLLKILVEFENKYPSKMEKSNAVDSVDIERCK
jgi:type I restriction enzyme M protein